MWAITAPTSTRLGPKLGHQHLRERTVTIYEEKTEGVAKTREQYMTWLVNEVAELGGSISPKTVQTLAGMLGPNEDFDGLPCEVAQAGGVRERDLYLSLG